MENGSKKGMVITAIVGVMAAVAYMYLKNNLYYHNCLLVVFIL